MIDNLLGGLVLLLAGVGLHKLGAWLRLKVWGPIARAHHDEQFDYVAQVVLSPTIQADLRDVIEEVVVRESRVVLVEIAKLNDRVAGVERTQASQGLTGGRGPAR